MERIGGISIQMTKVKSDETFSNIFNHCVPLQSLLLCMHNDFYRMLFQNREGMERGNPLRSTVYRKGLFHLMNETINPGIISKPFFPSSTLLHSRTFFSIYIFTYTECPNKFLMRTFSENLNLKDLKIGLEEIEKLKKDIK